VCCKVNQTCRLLTFSANTMKRKDRRAHTCCVAVCCSVLQCVAVCCSVLQCPHIDIAVRCSMLQRVLQCVAACAAVRCSVLHCLAVCCSVQTCRLLTFRANTLRRKDRRAHECQYKKTFFLLERLLLRKPLSTNSRAFRNQLHRSSHSARICSQICIYVCIYIYIYV